MADYHRDEICVPICPTVIVNVLIIYQKKTLNSTFINLAFNSDINIFHTNRVYFYCILFYLGVLFHCMLISKLPPRLLSGPTTISPVSLNYFAVITILVLSTINQIYYTSTNYLSLLPLQLEGRN